MATSKTKKTTANKSSTSNEQSSDRSNPQLEELFMNGLKDLYWAEKHLIKELPKMSKSATTPELKDALDEHTALTEEHAIRLERVFEIMGKKAQTKKCDGMEGLLKEGQSVLEETEQGSMTRDVGIIMTAQKVEHYEISSYGTLATLANTMGQTEIAEILLTTLEEEKESDSLLTDIAENQINWEAEAETEEEM